MVRFRFVGGSSSGSGQERRGLTVLVGDRGSLVLKEGGGQPDEDILTLAPTLQEESGPS